MAPSLQIELHIKSFVRSSLRHVLARRWSRKLVNWLANRSGWYFKQRFHGAFGYVLKDYAGEWKDDVWEVKFLDSKIQIPLRADNLTTDWIVATTLLGHDVLEKQSYRNILLSPIRPEVFVDVGGNYGTHSLLMLSQAVDVIYFEPNSLCHTYFLSACSFNNFWPRVEHVALGDVAGTKELRYPESATWLGSMHPDTQAALQGSYKCVSECVQQSRLDSFSKDIPDKRLLVKIDAEGYELNILRGAPLIFAKHRPVVFFESSRDNNERDGVWEFFVGIKYEIGCHVWDGSKKRVLSKEAFLEHQAHNFWAAGIEGTA